MHVNTNFIQAPFSFRTLRRTKKISMLLKSIKSLITLVLLYEESHRRLDCVRLGFYVLCQSGLKETVKPAAGCV